MPMTTTSPETVLAEQVSALRFDDLPGPVVEVATQCVIDVLGVTIRGACEPTVTRLREALWVTGAAPGGASVIGTDFDRVRASDAALLNGTAGHVLDFDDVAGAISAHPSVPVFPAVLALAEERGSSGAELLTAFVAGYETEVRIGLALGASHYRRGFHTTATVGAIGAAAASAHLLGLDTKRTGAALAIGATQAAGLKGMFGTDCKSFHAGHAAETGVLAARLAERDFTATREFLTAPQTMGGTHSEAFDATELTVPFGEPWHVLDCLFKLHAACYLTHGAIEGALALRGAVALEEVESIEVRVPPGHLSACILVNPRTGLEGKFSLRFVTALALATGRTDESQFDEEHVLDPDLRVLADRVEVVPDEQVPPYAAVVTLRTAAGFERTVQRDVGTPAWTTKPAEQQESLVVKFRSLVTPVLGVEEAERLVGVTQQLPHLNRAAALVPGRAADDVGLRDLARPGIS